MIQKNKESTAYKSNVKAAAMRLQRLGYEQIKADCEGYEQPSRLVNRDEDKAFVPDLTARLGETKSYFEIAQRSDPERTLITKWKLLETIAGSRNGKFSVFAPRGHVKFAEEILARYQIQAEVLRI